MNSRVGTTLQFTGIDLSSVGWHAYLQLTPYHIQRVRRVVGNSAQCSLLSCCPGAEGRGEAKEDKVSSEHMTLVLGRLSRLHHAHALHCIISYNDRIQGGPAGSFHIDCHCLVAKLQYLAYLMKSVKKWHLYISKDL